jgi:hypothetical protein
MKNRLIYLLFFALFQFNAFGANQEKIGADIIMTSNGEPFCKETGIGAEPSNCVQPFSVYITSNGILQIKALYDVGLVKINILQYDTLIYCDQTNLSSGATADIQLPQGISGCITIELSNNNGAYSYGVTFIQ